MKVYVANRQQTVPIDVKSVQVVTKAILAFARCKYDEVNIHFVEEEEICQLHGDYFDDPSPTDCISFPMDSPKDKGYLMLGDVVVCPKAALEYAKAKKVDLYEELTLYLVHSLLHLLGYDDTNDIEREKMRFMEKLYMDHLHTEHLCLTPPLC